MKQEVIYVLDFGSQYAHLIVRRLRELGVHAELLLAKTSLSKLAEARGIVISGGPQNLSEKGALRIDKRAFSLGIPVLGVCYGLQLMAYELGGKVRAGDKREYGATEIRVTCPSSVFRGLPKRQMTWMSHGDQVTKLPKGFTNIAVSKNCHHAAFADEKRRLYGVQFHPEVMQTVYGRKMLAAFVRLTGAKRTWSLKGFVPRNVREIRGMIGKDHAVCALSGGVDSMVAASIVRRAIGNRLHCIFVDTGFMREGEAAQVKRACRKQGMRLKVVQAQKLFISRLKGVTDPERKRKIIGELFIRIFQKEARRAGGAKWLVQGTLYTDAITSGVSAGGKAAVVIKSHHNVGGLPKRLGFKLIEPLRELYKDEVRKVGRMLGLPREIVTRLPFPGPGLAVRIVGEVTKERLDAVRAATAIVQEEVERAGISKDIQHYYFAALLGVRSVGVQGDARTYGHPIVVRIITTADFMTADFARVPWNVLQRISNRITNEIRDVNRVVYDITSKPPATVEWE